MNGVDDEHSQQGSSDDLSTDEVMVMEMLMNDDDEMAVLEMLLEESSANERPGGSRPGKSPNTARGIEEGHEKIVRDYLCDDPVYPEHLFVRRFRMPSCMFKQICRVSKRSSSNGSSSS